jgi:hypothetical protein
MLAVALVFGGCSSSSSSNGTATSFNGKWVFELEQNGAAPESEIDLNFTQNGLSISSDASSTIDGFPCFNPEEPPSDTTNGTLSGSTFNLNFTLHSGQPDAQTLALTGTISDNGPQVNGTYVWSAGSCNSLQNGIFTAVFIPSLSGQYRGVLIQTASYPTTAMISEDPDFQTSASINVMNNPCLSAISPSLTQSGFSIGRLTNFFGTDASQAVGFSGSTGAQASAIDGDWTIAPGCSNQGNGGVFDLDNVAKSSAPPPNAQTAKLLAAPPSQQLLNNFQSMIAARRRAP